MATVNIFNLLKKINNRINTTNDTKELLILTKSLEVLKTGVVISVPSFANLPDASENIGKLYFVESDSILYFSFIDSYGGIERWVPITQIDLNLLWSWGANAQGQLGNNSITSRCSPGTVSGEGTNWCQVSGGFAHTAAIKTDGTLWTWGCNAQGRLGDGTTASRSSPGTVAGGGTTWCQVSGGCLHTAAIKTDGTLWTWGSNASGRLGDGTTASRSSPGTVAGEGTTWCQVSGGNLHMVAIKTDGTLWTWGSNSCGRLGDGTTVSRCSPGTIAGEGTNWCQVSGAVYHTTAIKTDGSLWAWGCNGQGRLGDGTATNRCSPVYIGPLWSNISIGPLHTAAIKTDGTLWTWGSNGGGQLGDGNTVNRCCPGNEMGNDSTWSKISQGINHTTAIKTDGSLWAWGCNGQGRLGDGTTLNRVSPGTVSGEGNTWCQISGGYYHTTSIKTDGSLWTWGCNGQGRLGDGTTVNRCSPVNVDGFWCVIVSQAAVKTNGTLWTWGGNGSGRLGDGTTVSRCSPGTVAGGGTTWCRVSSGSFQTQAIKTDGTLWTWGGSGQGQLGNGTTVARCSPGTVAGGGTTWCQVSGPGFQTAAIKTDGTLWTWGYGNFGQLGTGTAVNRCSPGTVAGGGTTWCQVSSVDFHTAAIKTDGTLWTWGTNSSGQLGTGTTVSRCSPGTVAGGGTTWCQVSANSNRIAAIKTDGTLWTWGSNSSGRLGDGTTVSRSSPGTVAGGGTTWCQVSGEDFHTVAIKTDGTLWTWGCNGQGRLGAGTITARCSPGTVAGEGTTWCQVSGGDSHTAAIKTDGILWSWGCNAQGQLGEGTTVSRCSPGFVGIPWCQVSGGNAHTAAIKTDGTLWTWGSNAQGRLGNGTTASRSSPGTVAGEGTNWCQVSGGCAHTAAIKTDGTLWTWGNGGNGRLGDGTTVSRCSPGTVAGEGTTWCQVSGGGEHTAAIKTDGTLWTWGNGGNGRLGDGTTVSRCSPGTVAGGGTTWCQVAAGCFHTLAIKTDRTIWTWGCNDQGRLGDGTIVDRSSPGTVLNRDLIWCQVSGQCAHTAAIKTDGTLWTWGSNVQGLLGDGTTVSRCSPGTVAGEGTTWCQVAAGGQNTSSVKTDGTLWTWGCNSAGAIGDGTTVSRCSPGTVAGGGTTWCQVCSGTNSQVFAITKETL